MIGKIYINRHLEAVLANVAKLVDGRWDLMYPIQSVEDEVVIHFIRGSRTILSDTCCFVGFGGNAYGRRQVGN